MRQATLSMRTSFIVLRYKRILPEQWPTPHDKYRSFDQSDLFRWYSSCHTTSLSTRVALPIWPQTTKQQGLLKLHLAWYYIFDQSKFYHIRNVCHLWKTVTPIRSTWRFLHNSDRAACSNFKSTSHHSINAPKMYFFDDMGGLWSTIKPPHNVVRYVTKKKWITCSHSLTRVQPSKCATICLIAPIRRLPLIWTSVLRVTAPPFGPTISRIANVNTTKQNGSHIEPHRFALLPIDTNKIELARGVILATKLNT